MHKNKGFTMVELLVVLVIVAILAAVATPVYLANIQRARASEAIAAMSLLRQAQRDYRVNHVSYYDVAADKVQNPLPEKAVDTSNGHLNAADVTAGTDGLAVDAATAQYFSNKAYTVDAADQTSERFTTPGPVDFVIAANGSSSIACSGSVTNCAVKSSEVTNYRIEMDNSGRVFISYDGGTKWSAY